MAAAHDAMSGPLRAHAATPIDPVVPATFALTGRVVTMLAQGDVRERATVWIRDGRIVTITDAGAPRPAGFEAVTPIATRGTIYPGLIDLHNHLPYNVLPLWQVPKRYTNRDQWGSGANPRYRPLISGPMGVLGRPEYLPAVVRYVEVKALLGGATTTEGIKLYSDKHGGQRYYRGIVRNVEQTDDPLLAEGATRIADVDATSLVSFDRIVQKPKKLLLHLAEGVDATARNHFLALKLPPPGIAGREWALSPSLIGIHCAGLADADFGILADSGTSMIWSPMSNLLLYGGTADVAAAHRHDVTIGLGPDWSPSGSKNLLGELKTAHAYSTLGRADALFTPYQLVSMVTSNAARILGWQGQVGTLADTNLADLVVVHGTTGDAYEHLIGATDADLSLVMINGVARFGLPSLVTPLLNAQVWETITVGGKVRRLHLAHPSADPAIGTITLAQARDLLTATLADLPDLEHAPSALRAGMAAARNDGRQWRLALDELYDTGEELRPRLEYRGTRTAPITDIEAATRRAAATLPLVPVMLDPLTVADDTTFHDRLATQANLPPGLAAAVSALY